MSFQMKNGGSPTHLARMTGKERVTIKRLAEKGLPRYKISEKTGRSPVAVAKLLGPDPKGRGGPNRRPVEHIAELTAAGLNYREIKALYGYSFGTISRSLRDAAKSGR
jgi:IS30 family transposase